VEHIRDDRGDKTKCSQPSKSTDQRRHHSPNLAIVSGGARREGSSKTRATLIRKLRKRRPVSKKRPATHPTAGIAAAMTLTPAHFPDEQRSARRAVALAYRRAYRAGATEGGCHDAALREYRRVCSDAPADQLAASREVNRMAAAAINADTRWFWHGAVCLIAGPGCRC
jgi:hypothetical protein